MSTFIMSARESTQLDYAERMREVLLHIQRELDHPMAPADLAEVACFAPHHFHRIFKGMVGETIMEHVRRLRLERAAWRLKFTDQSVTDIAFDAQYENLESLTRAFGKMFGVSPSAYRRAQRSISYPTVASSIHYAPDDNHGDFAFGCDADSGPNPPRIERQPDRPVVYVRHVGPYQECKGAWDTLMEYAAREGLIGPGAEMLGLCHDDPDVTPPEKIRYDACITTTAKVQPVGEIGTQIIPGGEYAIQRHRGPYESLEGAYRQLFGSVLPALGREPAPGACVEKYWNDPESTDPEDLETDVSVLIN